MMYPGLDWACLLLSPAAVNRVNFGCAARLWNLNKHTNGIVAFLIRTAVVAESDANFFLSVLIRISADRFQLFFFFFYVCLFAKLLGSTVQPARGLAASIKTALIECLVS